jgi:hypothetical protein
MQQYSFATMEAASPLPTPFHVLLVDDDPDIRTIGELSLVDVGGMRCTSVASGQDAIDRALEDEPDVVLLDVMMPCSHSPAKPEFRTRTVRMASRSLVNRRPDGHPSIGCPHWNTVLGHHWGAGSRTAGRHPSAASLASREVVDANFIEILSIVSGQMGVHLCCIAILPLTYLCSAPNS